MRAQSSGRGLHNVPAELTSFVGRRRELAEIKRRLGASRLVTLTGPGGVGKTRLALRAAAEMARALPDGVWLVELAGLGDPALVPQAVFIALDLRDQSSGWLLAALGDFLSTKHVLLVLDNCEHLVDACAVLADSLLRRAPDLRILTTSRQPLSIAGETTFAVPPLSLPADSGRRPDRSAAPSEAVMLFVDRARAIVPGFELSGGNEASVGRLCRRLDGIPLAIELAAVRLRALSLEQVVVRLDDQFGLLTAGSRAAMPRHQTLWAAIDWSYKLLPEDARILFRRVAVFAGFDLDSAERVCATDPLQPGRILELVSDLVEQSLIVRIDRGGAARYRLLEPIRQYARERLRESGEEGVIRLRHRDWVAEMSAEAWVGLRGIAVKDWIDRVQLDLDNIRIALDYCLSEPQQADIGLEIASALWFYWYARGQLSEGRRWIDQLLTLDAQPQARAHGLRVSGHLAQMQSDMERSQTLLEESRALAERIGDEETLAFTLLTQASGLLFQGNPAAAVPLAEQALAKAGKRGDRWSETQCLWQMAMMVSFTGDRARAMALYDRALDVAREVGDPMLLSYVEWALGLESWGAGDFNRAAALQSESLRLKRPLDERIGMAYSVEGLAWLAASEGRLERAATLLGASKSMWAAIPAPLPGAFTAGHDHCEAEVRSQLGGRFDALTARGAEMGLDRSIAYALEEAEAAAPIPARRAQTTDELSRREHEIAVLVAQGLSNKDIATKLVVSERTVESHVWNILNKLGFNSRIEIASWVTAQQPLAVAPKS